jgi:hypothetical protein
VSENGGARVKRFDDIEAIVSDLRVVRAISLSGSNRREHLTDPIFTVQIPPTLTYFLSYWLLPKLGGNDIGDTGVGNSSLGRRSSPTGSAEVERSNLVLCINVDSQFKDVKPSLGSIFQHPVLIFIPDDEKQMN